MTIYNNEREIIAENVSINNEDIEWSEIFMDESIAIPFTPNDDIMPAINNIAMHTGWEIGWTYVDYSKTKTQLMIDPTTRKATLMVETFPEQIPQEERAGLMEYHTKAEVKGTEEYKNARLDLQAFFDAVDGIYRDGIRSGEYAMVDVVLTVNEWNDLLWGLIQEFVKLSA